MLGLALVATLASAGAVPRSEAASAARIDANVRVTLNEFFSRVRGSRELVSRSAAVLVFPSVIKAGIVFVTPEALAAFRRTSGWKAGVDASVAIITVGAGGSIDTSRIASPVIGFVFDGTGLMFNLTLDGTKITQIQR
jgi:lipid-binding SYLF domain-containing protein